MAGTAKPRGGAKPATTRLRKSAAAGAATAASPGKAPAAGKADAAAAERRAIMRALLPADTAGLSPLDVMLLAMRAHCAGAEPDLDKAAAIAKSIAPYVHPRFASIDPPGGGEEEGAATRPPPSARELARAILAIIGRAGKGGE
jgi:hypothetical protein